MSEIFKIYELQSCNSSAEPLFVRRCADLMEAKMVAERSQTFMGTTLVVEDDSGNRLALTDWRGRWSDINENDR